jgi:enoyl-CoA hydratase/carnithine racemase
MDDIKLKQLIYRTQGKLARVILNRPEALNAFSLEWVAELDAISRLIEDDRGIRVLRSPGPAALSRQVSISKRFRAARSRALVWCSGSVSSIGSRR